MKLSIPESKLNSKGWVRREERIGWERKGENWMGKCLGERRLNKKAVSGIYGLEIRYIPEWTGNGMESPAAYRSKTTLHSRGMFPLLFSLQNLWLCT